ncbi:MADS-box transcription factor 16-like [Typha latifolia]|uniref:MADS-box transcription factor 16-like n=1 Tax=Typha latifolia TaxID=4733 RepID=UPI003C30DC86
MGRGKIEIKKIENPTSRQVTYSKRRTGIMKKAKEITVLCDAQVAIVMFSNTQKLAEYCSPNTDLKKIFDRYQQTTQIDLWSSQYDKMQTTLNHLKEINRNLRKEIRQRIGEDLDGMDIHELRGLEQNLDETLKVVRLRKIHKISTQINTWTKKCKSAVELRSQFKHSLGMRDEHPIYGFVDNYPSSYESPVALANAGPHMYALRVQPSQPNLHGMEYGSQDLRLAFDHHSGDSKP